MGLRDRFIKGVLEEIRAREENTLRWRDLVMLGMKLGLSQSYSEKLIRDLEALGVIQKYKRGYYTVNKTLVLRLMRKG